MPYTNFANFIYFTGNLIGMIFLGSVSDWYGRKRAFQIYTIMTFAVCIGNYFANDPNTWLVFRFFGGIAFLSMTTVKNVLQVTTKSLFKSEF